MRQKWIFIFLLTFLLVLGLGLGSHGTMQGAFFIKKVQTIRDELAAWGKRMGVQSFLDQLKASTWSLFPALHIEKNKAFVQYRSPVEGAVYAFYEQTSGVVIETSAKSMVHPVATGWVKSVMDTATRGRVITILHADGTESMYGFMGEVWVKAGDWVEPEDQIGRVKEQSLFLTLRRTGSLINPAGVIPLD